jgi:hypothetical protein
MFRVGDDNYLTVKEASHKYHFSKKWFQTRRTLGDGPKYVKLIPGKGTVYYKESTLEQWFKDHMQERLKEDF